MRLVQPEALSADVRGEPDRVCEVIRVGRENLLLDTDESHANISPKSIFVHHNNRNTKDLLPFKSDALASEQTRKFLLGVIKICLDYVERQNSRAEKVVEFYQPDEIMKMFDFSIPDTPLELDKLVEDCRKTLSLQVKTGKFIALAL